LIISSWDNDSIGCLIVSEEGQLKILDISSHRFIRPYDEEKILFAASRDSGNGERGAIS